MSATRADFLLLPCSPLVFRSGKPFGTTGGGDAFGFPPPATLAGALRAEFADAFDVALDEASDHAALRNRLESRGPLLARDDGSRVDVFFPSPADAVYLEAAEGAQRPERAEPVTVKGGSEDCDLPPGLLPVHLQAEENAKRVEGTVFWSEAAMTAWLCGGYGPVFDNTVPMLPADTRTHVGIDPEALTHDEGRLFQSTGLDFGRRRVRDLEDTGLKKRLERQGHYFVPERWGLLARLRDSEGADLRKHLDQHIRRLGADGRSVRVAAQQRVWPKLPDPIDKVLKELKAGDRFRLILATPAIFAEGWRPGWLHETTVGGAIAYRGSPPGLERVVLGLVAAAIERWSPYSGWDMGLHKKKPGQPRAVRRLAPAGSVYWLELVNGPAAELGSLWLAPVSDDKQDQRDGFGLALLGVG